MPSWSSFTLLQRVEDRKWAMNQNWNIFLLRFVGLLQQHFWEVYHWMTNECNIEPLQSMNRASARKVQCIQKGFRTLIFSHFVMLPTYTKINHLKDDSEKWDAPEPNFKCRSKGLEYICQCDISAFIHFILIRMHMYMYFGWNTCTNEHPVLFNIHSL